MLDFTQNNIYCVKMIRRTFKYRIFPNKSQIKKFERSLDSCRWLYNHFLEQRKNSWEINKKSLFRYEQSRTIPILKKNNLFLNDTYSQVLQDVSVRIDLAFRAFFKRIKSGGKPGYPRFKGKFRYNSFTYPQSGFKILKNIIQLSKIGNIKIKICRPINGKIKTCTIRRTATNKWFVNLSCEIDNKFIKQSVEPSAGIDMGLEHFITISNGEHIKNPRFFRKEEKTLSKAQRKFSAQKKASKSRAKARKVVARIHERISNKRHNFTHQLSREIINKYNTVCVEDLSINNMQKDNFRCLNKSISDAAWQMFIDNLDYKAAEAGKRVIKINPAYTSQICSQCGTKQKLKLSDRSYLCSCCGLSINRDINAAKNILTLGMQGLVSA